MRSSPFDRFVRIQPGHLPVLDEFGHRLGRAWHVINKRTRIGRRYFTSFIATGAAIAIESIRHPSTTTVIPAPSVIVASGDNARAAELTQLAHELRKMREALKVHLEGEDPEKIRQIGVLASAERAARKGDGPAAERHLQQATEWVYLVALSIGAKRTAHVIARLIDL